MKKKSRSIIGRTGEFTDTNGRVAPCVVTGTSQKGKTLVVKYWSRVYHQTLHNGRILRRDFRPDDERPPKKENPPRQWVYLFKPQFTRPVFTGVKCRTIRPERADGLRPKVGDRVSLRQWSGKPYASKQSALRESTIVRVSSVQIKKCGDVIVDGETLIHEQLTAFAHLDGFLTRGFMLEFFEKEHGLPFKGVLIEWEEP